MKKYISFGSLDAYDKLCKELVKNEYNVDTDDMTDEEVVKHFRKLNAKRKEEKAREEVREEEKMNELCNSGSSYSHKYRHSSALSTVTRNNNTASIMLTLL